MDAGRCAYREKERFQTKDAAHRSHTLTHDTYPYLLLLTINTTARIQAPGDSSQYDPVLRQHVRGRRVDNSSSSYVHTNFLALLYAIR